MTIRHSITATGTDDPDSQVSVDGWNADHDVTGLATSAELTAHAATPHGTDPTAEIEAAIAAHATATDPTVEIGAAVTSHDADADAHADLFAGLAGGSASGVLVHAAAQSGLAHNAAVTWANPPVFDPDGYWNSGTPTRLTVPTGKGGRLFHVYATLEALDSGNNPQPFRLIFGANLAGAFAGAGNYLNGPLLAEYIVANGGVLLLADGDYVEVFLGRGNSADNNKIITGDQMPTFALAPIG